MIMVGAEGSWNSTATEQHKALRKVLNAIVVPSKGLPEEVFAADSAFVLPDLPSPTFLTSCFKHARRKEEAQNMASFLRKLGKVIKWPYDSILEGQGEAKWFRAKGKLIVVVGYGFRSSKRTVDDLKELFTKIYKSDPPIVVGVKLLDPAFYHMNLATNAIRNDICLVQAGSISDVDVCKMERLGIQCFVRPFGDPLALNGVSTGHIFHTHVLTPEAKHILVPILSEIGRSLDEHDISEFVKEGGGVRSMVLSIY